MGICSSAPGLYGRILFLENEGSPSCFSACVMDCSALHNSCQAPGLLCEDGEGDLGNSDYKFGQCSFSVKEPSKERPL